MEINEGKKDFMGLLWSTDFFSLSDFFGLCLHKLFTNILICVYFPLMNFICFHRNYKTISCKVVLHSHNKDEKMKVNGYGLEGGQSIMLASS